MTHEKLTAENLKNTLWFTLNQIKNGKFLKETENLPH